MPAFNLALQVAPLLCLVVNNFIRDTRAYAAGAAAANPAGAAAAAELLLFAYLDHVVLGCPRRSAPTRSASSTRSSRRSATSLLTVVWLTVTPTEYGISFLD